MDPRTVAYHEAGHLVMSMLLGIKVSHAFVSRTGEKSKCPFCDLEDIGHINVINYRTTPSHDRMLMLAAGEAAQRHFCGSVTTANTSDMRQIRETAVGMHRWLWPFSKKLVLEAVRMSRHKAREFAYEHNVEIEQFAKALLGRGIMNEQQIGSYWVNLNLIDPPAAYRAGTPDLEIGAQS